VESEGGRDATSGVSSGVVRRDGSGGGTLSIGIELAKESRFWCELPLPFRRGGGGGGTVGLGREGALGFGEGELLFTLSFELLMLSEDDRACPLTLVLGARSAIAGGNDLSEDPSSENGLCLEEELELG